MTAQDIAAEIADAEAREFYYKVNQIVMINVVENVKKNIALRKKEWEEYDNSYDPEIVNGIDCDGRIFGR